MKNTNRKGFTLVELMIVITIIGVLVGLLTPMVQSAQRSALKTTTKVLLTDLCTALERYRDEYGYFPTFLTQRERTNLDDGSYSENFVKALTGKDPSGGILSPADRREFNRKARTFIEFDNDNLIQKGGNKWKVVDSFENPNIYICVDGDSDGFIKQGFPTATDGINPSDLRELVPNPQTGLRAKSIAFTLKKDSKSAAADYSSEDVFSW